jgi:very-short-patch-repair endonuclease
MAVMPRRVPDAQRLYRRIAAGQYGLINRTQLSKCGIDKYGTYRRVKSGELVRLLPEVYRLDGTPFDPRQALMAASLWAGERAMISHSSAAALYGWPGFTYQPVHISAPHQLRPDQNLVTHETDLLELDTPTWVGPIPATSGSTTLFHLAAIRHERLEAALDHAIRRSQVKPEQMLSLIDDPAMVGRRGIRGLAEFVECRTEGRALTHSELEDLLVRILRKHRLPLPRGQWPINLAGFQVHADFAYPDCKIAIECDSYTWHTDRAAFDRDRERDAELQALGWIVLRFTWRMLKWRKHYVVDQIRKHLQLRGAPSLFAL